MVIPGQALNWTPYLDLNRVLNDLLQHTQEILGRNFVGAYLQGSFAVGDFDAHSDVDFIVVTEKELTGEQVARLQEMHGRIYDRPISWAQHLEGSYFPRRDLFDPPRSGDEFWYLEHGARSLARSDHCNTYVVRWSLREKGITLAGPPPETLLPPIPGEALTEEVRTTLLDWGQEILDDPQRFNNRFYQGFILLSYCRMLHALEFGEIASKKVCAEWAKGTIDPSWSDLIDRAWATRPDPARSVRETADPDDYARTLQFVRDCLEKMVNN